jgi:predicted transposase/invertase (TIGR01784 family)
MSNRLIRFDWAIKNILRDKSNFVILEGFLSELLKEDITIIEILESESNKERESSKLNRVDILAKDRKESYIIFEIQVTKELDYLSRILFGVSKVISERLNQGIEYKNIKKVYSVNIVYFDLGHGEDYVYKGNTNFYGMHKQDKLDLNEQQKKIYSYEKVEEIFPEYYILKVEQFDNETKDSLDEWIYFLKNEQIKDGSKAKGLKEAKEKLDILYMKEQDRREYDRYLDELHYESSMVESSYGIGKIEGIIEERLKIASNLLDVLDNKTISLKTGLSEKEIEELRKI